MNTPFLAPCELAEIGLRGCGDNVLVSRHALIFNPGAVQIGSNVRIDAFAILSAGPDGLSIGDYSHVAAGVKVYGSGGRVTIGKYCQLSANSTLYTANDDWCDGHLMGPMVPNDLRRVHSAPVTLERFSAVGCGAVVLPGVTIQEGGVLGALSLAKSDIPSGQIHAGIPAKSIGRRNIDALREKANAHEN